MRLLPRHAASLMVQVDGATSFGGATRSFSGASLLQDDKDGGYAVRPVRPNVAFSIRMRRPVRHAASLMVQVDGATSFGGATRSFSGASLLQDDKEGGYAVRPERPSYELRTFFLVIMNGAECAAVPLFLLRAGLLAPAR
jgi:hypothetical protein